MCVSSNTTNLSLAALNLGKTAGERVELQIPLAQDPSPAVTSSGCQGKHGRSGWAYTRHFPNSSPTLDSL